MASAAMHTTIVMGVMAQIEEAGMMTPDLHAFFKVSLLCKDATSDASSVDEKVKKVRKQKKPLGEKRPPTEHNVLVSKCLFYIRDDAFQKMVSHQQCMGAAAYMAKAIKGDPTMSMKEACDFAVRKVNTAKDMVVFPLDEVTFKTMKDAFDNKPTKPVKEKKEKKAKVDKVSADSSESDTDKENESDED